MISAADHQTRANHLMHCSIEIMKALIRDLPIPMLVLTTTLLLPAICFGEDETPPQGELIAPAFRAERHFEAGATYLRDLPDQTRIIIERNDGTRFSLALEGGVLQTQLPPASLAEEKKVFVSPLGFRVFVNPDPKKPGVIVESPSGGTTRFVATFRHLEGRESDGGYWSTTIKEPVLRLSDGTRIDVLENRSVWEVYTLAGERYRLPLDEGSWTALPTVPSPPLIPDIFSTFVAGDGDDWRRPLQEDHMVFAWNWYPHGLSIEQAIEAVRKGPRRLDLNLHFNGLDRAQQAPEMAAYVLGRRLCLAGGDRVTFVRPGEDPITVFLLPSEAEPDFISPPKSKRIRLPNINIRER